MQEEEMGHGVDAERLKIFGAIFELEQMVLPALLQCLDNQFFAGITEAMDVSESTLDEGSGRNLNMYLL
jgi:hypothetical protein